MVIVGIFLIELLQCMSFLVGNVMGLPLKVVDGGGGVSSGVMPGSAPSSLNVFVVFVFAQVGS